MQTKIRKRIKAYGRIVTITSRWKMLNNNLKTTKNEYQSFIQHSTGSLCTSNSFYIVYLYRKIWIEDSKRTNVANIPKSYVLWNYYYIAVSPIVDSKLIFAKRKPKKLFRSNSSWLLSYHSTVDERFCNEHVYKIYESVWWIGFFFHFWRWTV